MSSFAGYCTDCGKPVMHKTFFGTLHVCITDEEKAIRDRNKMMYEAQMNATPNYYYLKSLSAAKKPYKKPRTKVKDSKD